MKEIFANPGNLSGMPEAVARIGCAPEQFTTRENGKPLKQSEIGFARIWSILFLCFLVCSGIRSTRKQIAASITGQVVDVSRKRGTPGRQSDSAQQCSSSAAGDKNTREWRLRVSEPDSRRLCGRGAKVRLRAGRTKSNPYFTTSGGAYLQIRMEIRGTRSSRSTVTAEISSFKTDESSTATKMNIPLNEIPQGVGVANQSLIQSQQDIGFADAAENISGVNRDALLAGDVGNALTIRGLPLGIFSNYYRDGFAFDGMVPSGIRPMSIALKP